MLCAALVQVAWAQPQTPGVIVAEAKTMGDELIVADCDLDKCRFNKETIFDFAAHRRPEHYRLIVERTGAEPPEPGE